jgi:serine phosphatase RsbU (regulator of sigma subunit)
MDLLNIALQNAKKDTTRLRIYQALCDECETKDNLKYGTTAITFADKLLLETKNDIERKNILKYKARYYNCIQLYYSEKNDTSKMLEFGRKTISIFREVKDTEAIVNLFIGFQDYYVRIGNFPVALEYNHQGLAISKEMNYNKGIASFLMEIGIMSADQGENSLALENFQNALLIRTKLKDTIGIANAEMRMVLIYGALHNITKAVELYQKAVLLYKEKKSMDNVILANDWIGHIYEANNDLPNALINYKNALLLSYELKDNIWAIGELCNVGQIYAKQGNINTALDHHCKALKIAEDSKNEYTIAVCSGFLAFDYMEQKDCKKAKDYGDRCLKLMKETKSIIEIELRELLVSQIDSACGNGNEAYEHYKQYIILRDKLKSEDIHKAATKEKFQTEYDKQKAIDKKEQEKKDAIVKAESKKQKLIILFVALGLFFVLMFAGFIFRSLRTTNKQKDIIEEKNREITDSIEYALRIQTAILPPQKTVKQYLANSFILYKPKDIVAGDFYWMETVNDLVLFAACDCTGHGVPGAMVSVVCHNALNRAVREFGLTQPAEILDKTAEIVIENFSKSEEDIKDGMDISLCAYNAKTKTIQWAGANNPLWLLQKGELIETKADKQPIGMNENSKPFTNHTFTLNSGDTIYLFTDGFADQFGGDTGEKKLTKRRFKDLLLSVQTKSLQEQGIALDKFITEYRKQVEQIDDILVMGVKV